MTDLAAAEQQWQDWISDACAAVGSTRARSTSPASTR